MLPVILSIGPITVYSLGFLAGIGFFLAAFIIWRRWREIGLDEEKVIDFLLVSAILSLVLAKLLIFLESRTFSGFTFGGVFLGTFLTLGWFSRKEKWDFWGAADELGFGLLPLSVLFQVGVFLDGSSPGRPTGMPWGVYFPGSLVRTHPVSLFSALGFFLIWLFLLGIERKWRFWKWYRSKNSGFLALVFLALVFLANFLVAFWRHSRIYWYWFEIALSLLGAIGAGLFLFSRSGRRLGRKKP